MGNNKENNIKNNNIEKSLTVTNKSLKLMPLFRTATGIVFYAATFIVSVAIGYIFIFTVFN